MTKFSWASLLVSLALLGPVSFVGAQPPLSFIVHSIDGPLPPGPLIKFAENWNIRLGGANPKLIDGAEFIALRRLDIGPPPLPLKNVVLLTNGDWLPFVTKAGLPSLQEDNLRLATPVGVRSADKERMTLPLAFVSVIWFTAPAGEEEPAAALWRLHQSRRARDVVLFRNGDRLEGAVKGLDATGELRLLTDEKEIDLPLSRLAAVAFGTELQARPRSKGPIGVATLAGGARLSFANLALDADRTRFAGKILAGPNVSFPLEQLIALDLLQGKAVYLAELPVLKFESTAYLGLTWPLGKNQAVGGGSLRLAEAWYDKGLGTRGQCAVTYRLDGGYRRFEAWAGLDQAAGPRSRLQFKVLVDGREMELPAKGRRTRLDPPLEIQLDLKGGKELTLRADFDGFGDVQALATWANARLIKK